MTTVTEPARSRLAEVTTYFLRLGLLGFGKEGPPVGAGLLVLAFLVYLMVKWPLAKAGSPDEPPPPASIM